MIFDTHAHLDDRAFDEDRPALLDALPTQGIRLVMNPGCSLASSRAAAALAAQQDYVYAAVGSHPDAADEVTEAAIEAYRAMALGNPKVKAIGEIGLDYHYEAHEDGMNIVEAFPAVKGVFHCYSGSLEMAKVLIKKGWYIGFGGVLTFKNARKAVEVASQIPLERIVLETDCPYMSPEPFRGRRNDPSRLGLVAEKLAAIRGLSVEEIEAVTLENGKRLYGIGE